MSGRLPQAHAKNTPHNRQAPVAMLGVGQLRGLNAAAKNAVVPGMLSGTPTTEHRQHPIDRPTGNEWWLSASHPDFAPLYAICYSGLASKDGVRLGVVASRETSSKRGVARACS